MSETTKRIFCLFPGGRDPQRATGRHWAGERDYGTDKHGCCRGLLRRHPEHGSWKPAWERGKGSSLPGRWPSQEMLKGRSCKRVQPFPPGQETQLKSPPTSCTSPAGSWSNFTGHPCSASTRPNRQLARPGKVQTIPNMRSL